MTKIEAILQEASALSERERRKLIELLRGQATNTGTLDDDGVGQRGLEAWTESTQAEDWSAYYPPELTNSRSRQP